MSLDNSYAEERKNNSKKYFKEMIRKRIFEAMIDKDGNLLGFSSPDEEYEDFLLQWSLWLEDQFGEKVEGFELYDVLSSGGDWLRDEYTISIDLYPNNEPKIRFDLFKQLDE